MTPAELRTLLEDFYRDLSWLAASRQANARSVTAYDANNAYQQVLARQETHLRWVADAIADLGGTTDLALPQSPPERASSATARGRTDLLLQIIEGDVRAQKAFIALWQPRVLKVTNARHRKMLELILGEMEEHRRAFEQALSGRTDVLGRHADGKELSGEVLPGRPRG